MQGVRGSSPLSSTHREQEHPSPVRRRVSSCPGPHGAAGSGSAGLACRGSGVRVPSAPHIENRSTRRRFGGGVLLAPDRVAQLVAALLVWHAGGQGFESPQLHTSRTGAPVAGSAAGFFLPRTAWRSW